MRVVFHPLALRELHRASERYERHRAGLGDEFYQRIEDGVALIKQFPVGQPLISHRCRRRLLRQFPYGLVYAQTQADKIVIVAVAHTRRRPAYWKRRVT